MMYCRALRRLFVLSESFSKCLNVTRSFNGMLEKNSQFMGQNRRTNLIHFRQCTSFSPPDKDKIGQELLDEYLKDPENEKHFKVLQLEVDVMRQSGECVPSILKPRHWAELVQLKSRIKRWKYLNFIFGIEKKREHRLEKKKIPHVSADQTGDDSHLPDYLQYKLGGNMLILRCYDSQINSLYNWRLIRAMMYGQKLVFDCGHEDKMTRQEIKTCARQLQLAFSANRMLRDPFDIHFCEFNTEGLLHQELYAFMPTMHQPHFPMNITRKSYLDLFDKQKLVYLTPDCNQELTTFDNDAVYIIGSIVDKACNTPLTMAKAKREGVRMAKLPIDRYLDFGGGSGKALTLNQMVQILGDMKRSGHWSHALRHVPRRKLLETRECINRRKIEKILRDNGNTYGESSSPQDYSIRSRNKFRNY